MEKSLLNRFCGMPWLYITYALGIIMFNALIWQWDAWSVSQKLVCMMAIALPIHVFEELSWPNGFQFMMNKLVQKSPEPLVNPENRFTDMLTNLGAEILFIVLIFVIPHFENPLLFVIAFFGIGETLIHALFGILSLRHYKGAGKKTIYAPGLASAALCMLPVSVAAIHYMVLDGTFALPDLGWGLLIMACIMLFMIRLPMIISGKVNNPNYAYDTEGYFAKFEHR